MGAQDRLHCALHKDLSSIRPPAVAAAKPAHLGGRRLSARGNNAGGATRPALAPLVATARQAQRGDSDIYETRSSVIGVEGSLAAYAA